MTFVGNWGETYTPQRLAAVYRQGSAELADNIIIANTGVSQLVNGRRVLKQAVSPCAHHFDGTMGGR